MDLTSSDYLGRALASSSCVSSAASCAAILCAYCQVARTSRSKDGSAAVSSNFGGHPNRRSFPKRSRIMCRSIGMIVRAAGSYARLTLSAGSSKSSGWGGD
eukprot:6176817-Pleurochrysis_carterae.AAC.2